jgi:UDP-glucose 4-epimerase
VLIASSERVQHEAGWQPRFGEIDSIVRTALAWREAHPNGYATVSSAVDVAVGRLLE